MLPRIQPKFILLAFLLPGLSPSPARAQWTVDGAALCTAPSNQFTPAAVADGAGGVVMAWYDYRGANPDIYAQHALPSGMADPAWPANGRALCTASGGQYAPTIVADGAGGAIVVWYDGRAGNSTDIYAQHVLASGTWDPAWPENGRALCTASDDQIYPAITTDGAGGAIATWRDYRGGPDTDVYAQHVMASGVVDPAWPVDGRPVCTAGENQSVPSIAPDGAGGAFIAWSDLRDGTRSDIYAQHVLASGAVDPAWPENGRALCTASQNQSGPTIVADGSGGAIVTWFDYRSGLDADIYAQHVLGSGTVDPAWPTDGRALCLAVDEQYSPIVIAVGAGGAIVTWYDYRDGPEADIYAQRVLASGAVDPAWPADGRALCTAPGDQLSPSVAGDGAGGAVVSWYDYRSGSSSDVYAHHVRTSGEADPAWPADGRILCGAVGEQFSPTVVTDGAGGAVVAWTDFRGGIYSDIYAQRVYAGGAVAAVEWLPGPPVDLLPIRPNPARAGATTRLELPTTRRVTVEVLDTAGRRVRTLLTGELAAGPHAVIWDGADDAGVARTSGVYWVCVRAPGWSVARKLALLR